MKAVIFSVADKVYGIDIAQVCEVLRMRKITPIPDTLSCIEGVICLRGKPIPLINLRKKFGLPDQTMASSRILIATIHERTAGFLVDSVQSVENLSEEDITPPDDLLQGAHYLLGTIKRGGQVLLLADLSKLLHREEQSGLMAAQNRVAIKKKEPAV